MTYRQQYQSWLLELETEQRRNPSYPDLSWYAHTGQADKMEEIIKFGTTIPDFEGWLQAQLKTEEA